MTITSPSIVTLLEIDDEFFFLKVTGGYITYGFNIPYENFTIVITSLWEIAQKELEKKLVPKGVKDQKKRHQTH